MKKRLLAMVCLLLSAAGAFAASHWTINPHAFQYDMTVYAALHIGDKPLSDYTDYEVAAFCGEACRGVAKVQTAPDGTKYLYLRVYSNNTTDETIRFCVYQKSGDKELSLEDTIGFEAETMAGTPGDPTVLTLSGILPGDVNGDGEVNEVDAQLILDVSVGQKSLSDLAVPEAINVPGGNSEAYEVNAQIVLDYSVAAVKPW